MKLLDALKTATEFLTQAGIEDPSQNAELIVCHAANIDRLSAYRDNPDITDQQRDAIDQFVKRRAQGEPVQYLIGSVDFFGLTISVGTGVLIPRPETELLVEEAISEVRNKKEPLRDSSSFRILELCSGSGCISLALAREFPDATVFGTELSPVAFEYALKNAASNHIANAVFLHGSLFEPVAGQLPCNLILSNPPYIKSADINNLQPEIKGWEPREALDGGMDGLDFYRLIFKHALLFLRPVGKIMLEIGYDQANKVKSIAQKSGFQGVMTRKDMAGIERILIAERKSRSG